MYVHSTDNTLRQDKMAQIFNKFTAPYVDQCFRNNEFLDDNHLWDLIDYADNDALAFMFNNRHRYSGEIQYTIDPVDFIPPKVKMRVVYLSEKEMDKITAQNEARMKREMEEAWERKRSNMSRPLSDLDTDELMAQSRYDHAEQALRLYTRDRSAHYVAPSARGRPDAEKERLEKRLAAATLEIEDFRKRISQANDDYFARKKDEFFAEMYGL